MDYELNFIYTLKVSWFGLYFAVIRYNLREVSYDCWSIINCLKNIAAFILGKEPCP